MTNPPSSPTPPNAVLEIRDWSVAIVAAYVHNDQDAVELMMDRVPPLGTRALAMMCAAQIEVLAAMEGKTAEQAMQEFALRLALTSD